jgi:hypothetical protein
MNKLKVKSAGFIDGQYKIILSNGDELDGITYLNLNKEIDGYGRITIEIALWENFEEIKK